jgi:chromosome segregation ATPase
MGAMTKEERDVTDALIANLRQQRDTMQRERDEARAEVVRWQKAADESNQRAVRWEDKVAEYARHVETADEAAVEADVQTSIARQELSAFAGELNKVMDENANLRAVAEAAYDWFKGDRSDESWARMLKALRAAGYPKDGT